MTYQALLVDDDIHTLFLFEQILRPTGVGILKAEDGLQALEILDACTPTIIYLDLLLPHVNGLVVLDHIIGTPRLSRVPVVVVSSQSRSYMPQSASLEQVHTYLLKPIKPGHLLAPVRQIMAAAPG